nr:probable rRNA-processing protein EBP2 homolog [Ipomoea trifida]GMD34445.1 probable rRNA-processing protein EBP2 homolog [Ipomoea batatas]GMD36095.1 probable rRNA-processing protein EBP2 homolog [Ipomoea batatas]GMD39435.1 probable rRNA-processing protein EBP2 homolog [Ipomoea batatas]
MVKSDVHMEKVKGRLLAEKKARENKKLAKEQNGFDKDSNAELDLDLEDGKVFQRPNKKRPGVSPGDRSGGKGRPHGGNNKRPKFGFGGNKDLTLLTLPMIFEDSARVISQVKREG